MFDDLSLINNRYRHELNIEPLKGVEKKVKNVQECKANINLRRIISRILLSGEVNMRRSYQYYMTGLCIYGHVYCMRPMELIHVSNVCHQRIIN